MSVDRPVDDRSLLPPRKNDAVERLALTPDSPWWAEHRSRYGFASRILGAGTILDIACGSGLGGDLLARQGRALIGVDVSWEAMSMAQGAGYRLCMADGGALPFRDGVFDAVTSFETIEHLEHRERFLGELHRVLKATGTLVLSTPNALFTKPVNGVPKNPFHTYEYTPLELKDFLAQRFRKVRLLGHTPSSSYGPCPYWQTGESFADDARARAIALIWKAIVRLPRRTAEGVSRIVLGRELYPGVDDFSFDETHVDDGHVIVAICEK